MRRSWLSRGTRRGLLVGISAWTPGRVPRDDWGRGDRQTCHRFTRWESPAVPGEDVAVCLA
jgi:hypothetical protein